jgi:dethiobiotin synthetase
MTATFVTATGTEIGKTFVTAGLIRLLRAYGRPVEALKPVVTGFDAGAAAASDPGVLLAALGRPPGALDIERIAPWRYGAPLSPDMAARRENRPIDIDKLVEFCRCAVAAHRGTLLIEGIGGVMVPLDERHTVLDWMALLKLPVLLVAGSYLGSLSHTLTALDALKRRGLIVTGLVLNETAGSTVPLEDTLLTLSRFAAPIMVLPRLPLGRAQHPAFDKIAAHLGSDR